VVRSTWRGVVAIGGDDARHDLRPGLLGLRPGLVHELRHAQQAAGDLAPEQHPLVAVEQFVQLRGDDLEAQAVVAHDHASP
jgi:hypothetical protein